MVADAFVLLGLPRKAALDPELVKAAFQKAAAATHPDAASDEPDRVARTMLFQQLNEASALLTPAASRLKHLLVLEYAGFTPSRAAAMDEPLVALFTQVGAAVRAAAEWTRRRQAATTFLARAALTASEMQVQEALEAAGRSVREAQDLLQSAMVELDAAPAGQAQAETLSALSQRAAFLEKWQAQLQAAWAALFGAG
ncbi:MAG: DnaJ domain-containing protein [Verrucomicrobiota bacterium]